MDKFECKQHLRLPGTPGMPLIALGRGFPVQEVHTGTRNIRPVVHTPFIFLSSLYPLTHNR